jgi:hypothetical protein
MASRSGTESIIVDSLAWLALAADAEIVRWFG